MSDHLGSTKRREESVFTLRKRIDDWVCGRHIEPDRLTFEDKEYIRLLNAVVDGKTTMEKHRLWFFRALDYFYEAPEASAAERFYMRFACGESKDEIDKNYIFFRYTIPNLIGCIPETIAAKLSIAWNNLCAWYQKTIYEPEIAKQEARNNWRNR